MTSGPAPSADGQPNPSSTTPTDGPPTEPPTTGEIPVTRETLAEALEEMFRQGWRAARLLPLKNEPLDLRVTVIVNHETQELDIRPEIV